MTIASEFQAVWPGGAPAIELFPPAKRPASLNGKRIAFVWDYLFRGDEIFTILQEAIGGAYPDVTFVGHENFGSTLGANDHKVLSELPAKLAELGVDLVISGVGCCGACTPAVMRASAVMEKAGFPTASIVCEGFTGQANAVSPGLGCSWLPVVEVDHVDSLSDRELREMVLARTRHDVVRCFTNQPAATRSKEGEFGPHEIVAAGDFAAINEQFLANGWSDGLPIVPPTRRAVERFLEYTPFPQDHLIGCVQPSGSAATVWNVAVNGVMAGCVPESMPVLVAIAEAITDPTYGVEHGGDTTGGDPLIVLNGPIGAQLGFNSGNGALREGARANTSVGRFLRLFLRNVVGLRPGEGDKCTFGHSARIVLAEQETELARLGWSTFSERLGFRAGANVVTVGRFTGDTHVGSMYGRDPDDLATYLADGLIRQSGWELVFTAGTAPGTHRPLVVISPMIAKTLAKAGCDVEGLRERLYDRARIPAWKFEAYIGKYTNLVPGRRTLGQLYRDGLAAPHLAESEDPDRLVPIVEKPEHILIAVSGDPYRSNAIVFGSNGLHGFPTSKEIRTVP